jgi:hypothetical protein
VSDGSRDRFVSVFAQCSGKSQSGNVGAALLCVLCDMHARLSRGAAHALLDFQLICILFFSAKDPAKRPINMAVRTSLTCILRSQLGLHVSGLDVGCNYVNTCYVARVR